MKKQKPCTAGCTAPLLLLSSNTSLTSIPSVRSGSKIVDIVWITEPRVLHYGILQKRLLYCSVDSFLISYFPRLSKLFLLAACAFFARSMWNRHPRILLQLTSRLIAPTLFPLIKLRCTRSKDQFPNLQKRSLQIKDFHYHPTHSPFLQQ